MRKEVYICIKFGKKYSNDMSEKQLKDFAKNLEKNQLKLFQERIRNIDKGARVFVKTNY